MKNPFTAKNYEAPVIEDGAQNRILPFL